MAPSADALEALQLHNTARDELAEDPRGTLQWSDTLETAASEYPRVLADRDELEHSHDNTHGENLGWSSSRDYTMVDATQRWFAEKKKYKGEKIGERHGYGHYTQMIWPEVTKVGIASARSKKGGIYVVARYDHQQLSNRFPYDESKADVLKNRYWSKPPRDKGLCGCCFQ